GKFPADFYLRNFLCEPPIIPNGGDVHLTWERSANATYELLYPGTNRDVTDRTSLPLEGIKSDTTFYLRATAGDPTNPVVRILSAQVTVIKPDLRARLVEADALYAPGTHLRHTVLDTTTGNWSAPVWIPVATTDPSPSLASFGGRLHCSHFDGELRHWVGWDGKDWEYEELTVARRSRSAPAFSGPDGWIECAHGDREDLIDAYRSMDGGLTWGRLLAPQRQWNSTSPLAWGKTDGGWLFFLYRAPDDAIHFVHMGNDGSGGSRWYSKTLNDATSPFGVSAVTKGDDGTPAYCLLATDDGAMYLRSASYFEWGSPARVADFRTISKPVLLSVAGKFHCFFRDSSGVRWTTSTNRGQSWSGALLVPGAEASTRAPAVAQHDGYLHLVF
ncbi:sialidase family protein, partial [Streptomyces sp. NPDC058290]|uniref:sialidase family protein n=1 Tax=Streptomyces sp. NPDC058290 TaxID=3346426 RepID=UPI0036EC67DA